MRWVIGIAGLAIGGYFLFKHSKKEADISLGSMSSTAKPVKINQGGRATALVEPNWNASFDMNYVNDVKKWLQGKPIVRLSQLQATKFAKQIKEAKRSFNDDEEAVAQVFKRLQDKTQVADLSRVFYVQYKKDLYQYLRSFLSSSEMTDLVKKPVRNLPKYRLA